MLVAIYLLVALFKNNPKYNKYAVRGSGFFRLLFVNSLNEITQLN